MWHLQVAKVVIIGILLFEQFLDSIFNGFSPTSLELINKYLCILPPGALKRWFWADAGQTANSDKAEDLNFTSHRTVTEFAILYTDDGNNIAYMDIPVRV